MDRVEAVRLLVRELQTIARYKRGNGWYQEFRKALEEKGECKISSNLTYKLLVPIRHVLCFSLNIR